MPGHFKGRWKVFVAELGSVERGAIMSDATPKLFLNLELRCWGPGVNPQAPQKHHRSKMTSDVCLTPCK